MRSTMSKTFSLAALFALGALAGARGDEPDNPLLGGYTIVGGERAGKPIPAEQLHGQTVRIAKDGIVVTDKEKKEIFVSTYTLGKRDAAGVWKITMKSRLTPGGGEGMEASGLIEKKGDTVRLIYAPPDGDVPTEFKTHGHQLMFELKNERK